MSRYSRILVPIDGSPTAEAGLREAIALAAQLDSQLVLLYVVDDYPLMVEMASAMASDEMRQRLVQFAKDTLDQARKRAVEAGVATDTVLREVTSQRAAHVIVEEATRRQCQLIVMGTHGRRGFQRLALGSDAEMVLHDAPVPVLLVRRRES